MKGSRADKTFIGNKDVKKKSPAKYDVLIWMQDLSCDYSGCYALRQKCHIVAVVDALYVNCPLRPD